eukprot:4412023-Amphidinium_carterae.1
MILHAGNAKRTYKVHVPSMITFGRQVSPVLALDANPAVCRGDIKLHCSEAGATGMFKCHCMTNICNRWSLSFLRGVGPDLLVDIRNCGVEDGPGFTTF